MARLVALCVLSVAWHAESKPNLSFPFNAQLPPVARIDQFFSFSPSPHTFQSSSSILYSLENQPQWLSIDNKSGRLYGTPKHDEVPPGEVVGQTVSLVATDKSGSTSTNATLVISRDAGPSVQIPLARQIKSFGPYSAPSSLLLYPSTDFEYIFDSDTFSTPHMLNYYATSNDSSPLPSWVHFDADRLRFSGRTPRFESLIQPPQTFDISLVASDIIGFSGAWVSFSLVVGSHQLTTDNPIITLNVTKGSQLRYGRLDSGIKLDHRTVAPGDLSVSIEDMPPWLSYNVDEGRLQGTPKDGDHSTNFTINFRDRLQDTLSIMVVVNVNTGLFQSTFEDVQARPGDLFSLDLSPHFRDPGDIDLKIEESTPGADWLSADGLIVTGKVPDTAKGDLNLTIGASSRSTGLKEKEKLHVVFLAADGTIISATPSSAPSYHPTGVIGSAMNDLDSHRSTRRKTRTVLLATLLPLFLLTLLALSFILFKRRRRQVNEEVSEKQQTFKTFKDGPLMISLRARKAELASHMSATRTTIMQRWKSLLERRPVDAERGLQTTTQLDSSETMETMSVLEAPPAILSPGRSGSHNRVRTPNSDTSRDSWVTVQGTMTPSRSERSMQRGTTAMPNDSENTVDAASFRSAVDLSTAFVGEVSNIQSIVPVACGTAGDRNSAGRQTTTTIASFSAASPASQWRSHRLLSNIPGKWPLYPAPLRVIRAAAPITEEIEHVQQSSQQPRLSCPVLFRPSQEPSADRHSFMTASSFASTENWRPLAWQDTLKRTVDRFLPNRPSGRTNVTDVGSASGAPSRQSPELLSPSRWGEFGRGGFLGKEERGEVEQERGKLKTPPLAGFEFDYDAEFMSDGRRGAMRTIRTVLGEEGGDGANFI